MPLTLYNSLTRRKEAFEPLDPSRVRMYVCGPTVYDFAHIGNARAVVAFDLLYRVLRHTYGKDHVRYVRNITDVEDKIIAAARENGERDRRADPAHHRDLSRGYGGARQPAARYRAARDRIHPADDRDDRAADRFGPRLCGRGPCAVPCRLLCRVRDAVAAQPRRHDRRRPGRGRALQGGPGRFRACGSRRAPISRAGTARGAAAGRAGTSNARR